MHVPLTGRSDRQGNIEEELSEQEMIAWARESPGQRRGSRRGYDGTAVWNRIWRRFLCRSSARSAAGCPSQEKRMVTFEKRQRVEEARKLTEGNTGPPDRNSGSTDSICWWTATM